LACSDDGCVTVDKADHETQGLPCCGSNNYKEFASGSSAPQRKTPDREENVLPLKAIRRAPLVEFQTDIQSEGHVNIFNLAKNAGTSVHQIERFYGKKRMRDPKMATEVTKLREQ